MSQLVAATTARPWLTIAVRKSLNDGAAIDLAEIADMLDAEAVDASLSALQVDNMSALLRLSNDAAAHELGRWRRRETRFRTAAQTIRRQIRVAA
jgi:hypothetical protein